MPSSSAFPWSLPGITSPHVCGSSERASLDRRGYVFPDLTGMWSFATIRITQMTHFCWGCRLENCHHRLRICGTCHRCVPGRFRPHVTLHENESLKNSRPEPGQVPIFEPG